MASLFDNAIYEKKKYNFEISCLDDSIAKFVSCWAHTLTIEENYMFKLMERDHFHM